MRGRERLTIIQGFGQAIDVVELSSTATYFWKVTHLLLAYYQYPMTLFLTYCLRPQRCMSHHAEQVFLLTQLPRVNHK